MFFLIKVPWQQLFLSRDEIAAQVYIGEDWVGHLSNAELKNWLEEKNYHWKEQKIHLQADNRSFVFSLDEIGASLAMETMMREAYQVGRRGNLLTKLKERTTPVYLNYRFKLDKSIITTHLRQIQSQVDTPVKNGSITVNKQGEIITEPSVEGRKLDIDKTIEQIKQGLQWEFSGTIPLAVEKIIPFPTAKEMDSWHINGVVSEFVTDYKEDDRNRTHNIQLAAAKIDNVLLMPGELFSFNELVGPRDAAHGYKESLIIVNQEFVKGYGGGVCQLVSTLYNAVLRGDFTVVKRFAHSLPVSYVPLGMDATVAYGSLDFQFTNQYEFPVLVHTNVENGKLSVAIYGDVYGVSRQYKLYSKEIETYPIEEEMVIDETLMPGTKKILQQGTQGKKVETYRQIWQENKMIREEKISADTYKGKKTIIAVPKSED